MITLPIDVRPIVLPTPIHIMQGPLSYNILLGRPWIHAMKGVPSTLHRIMKFEYNNKIYMVDTDEQSYESYDHNISNSSNTWVSAQS